MICDLDEARRLVIATGFIALSRRFGNRQQDDMHQTIEDTIDTIGRGVLGLTLRCARCHDHKFLRNYRKSHEIKIRSSRFAEPF